MALGKQYSKLEVKVRASLAVSGRLGRKEVGR